MANIDTNPVGPFCEFMECSLQGKPVQYDVKGWHRIKIAKQHRAVERFRVEDTATGHVASVRASLSAHFYGNPVPLFDYCNFELANRVSPTSTFSIGSFRLEWLHATIDKTVDRDQSSYLDAVKLKQLFATIQDYASSQTQRFYNFASEWFYSDLRMLGVHLDHYGPAMVFRPRNDDPRLVHIKNNRESWIESVRVLLTSYLSFLANWRVEFDYSGLPSDMATGLLKRTHERIRQTLDGNIGECLTPTSMINLHNSIFVSEPILRIYSPISSYWSSRL